MAGSLGTNRYAIGLDVGGTFTDLAILSDDGQYSIHKVPTTPERPEDAVFSGISQLLLNANVNPEDVGAIIHSTTLITNSIAERKGCRVALITTKGFRDVLEQRHEHRYDVYDLFLEWPSPLVPRERRFAIAERTLVDGTVFTAPDIGEVSRTATELTDYRVEAVAISFLHSYRNPRNEHAVADALTQMIPGIPVIASSDIAPVVREYERTSTVVADAYVQPLVSGYLDALVEGLESRGFRGTLYLMLSNGGTASGQYARRYPIRLIESGPAAGAVAAGYYSSLSDDKLALSFEMGGTTAKLCLLKDGTPSVVNSLEVARAKRFIRGSGIPIVAPSVDLIEIGAGGGSIARIDPLGLLQVGPESAGAQPGPVCYGIGGTDPTVTDANLILGLLNPDYFLGGRMALQTEPARQAFHALGAESGITGVEAALAVHTVVNENMAQAARVHLQEHNVDARHVTMVASGGAGPTHAAAIARLLGITRIICPLGAGTASAFGCLTAPPTAQETRSVLTPLDQVDWEALRQVDDQMIEQCGTSLAGAGVATEMAQTAREADLRVRGQEREVTIRIPDGEVGKGTADVLEDQFTEQYKKLYGRYSTAFRIELVNWKVTMQAPARVVQLDGAADSRGTDALKSKRRVVTTAVDEVEVAVYDRYGLVPGSELVGPAVIEEREATVYIPADASGSIDEYGNLTIELA